MNKFFELAKIAIDRKTQFDEAPTQKEWEEMLRVAYKQSVQGVMAEVFYDRIPAEQFPEHRLFLVWMGIQKKITIDNRRLDECSAAVQKIFDEGGFRSCILKGQGTALYYPVPTDRQAGDVDVWVEGSRDAIIRFLKERGYKIKRIVYHHAEVGIFDDVEVEVHFRPSLMYNPITNYRLHRFFDEQKEAQFTAPPCDRGFRRTSVEFDAVFSLVHIYRHLLEEGVGLRQLMDYYYILHHLPAEKRAYVMNWVRRLRMKRFAGAVMFVLKTVFDIEDEYLLCPPDDVWGVFVLDEIMLSGNFGQFDGRLRRNPNDRRLKKFAKKSNRQVRFLSAFPSEVLAFPLFRVGQFLWRLLRGYDKISWKKR